MHYKKNLLHFEGQHTFNTLSHTQLLTLSKTQATTKMTIIYTIEITNGALKLSYIHLSPEEYISAPSQLCINKPAKAEDDKNVIIRSPLVILSSLKNKNK
jgi:hypothetical protein